MSVLIIGQIERDMIERAMARARKKPIPFDVLSASAIDQTTDVVTLAERRKDFHRPKSEQIMLPVGFRLAISYEEQPAGLCLHLSLSVDRPNLLPDPHKVMAVVQACGIDPDNPPHGRTWVEEFLIDGRPGGVAANVLFVVEPRAAQ
jgi:hypothetical protein